MFPKSVRGECITSIECFVTLGTLEWLDSTVDPHVCPERCLLAESFTAGVTHEGFIARVGPNVVLQLEHLLEIFPTEGADSLRLRQLEVSFPVSRQLSLRLEGLTADRTTEVNEIFHPAGSLGLSFPLLVSTFFVFGFPQRFLRFLRFSRGGARAEVRVVAVDGEREILLVLNLDVLQIVRVKQLRSLNVLGNLRDGLEILRYESLSIAGLMMMKYFLGVFLQALAHGHLEGVEEGSLLAGERPVLGVLNAAKHMSEV